MSFILFGGKTMKCFLQAASDYDADILACSRWYSIIRSIIFFVLNTSKVWNPWAWSLPEFLDTFDESSICWWRGCRRQPTAGRTMQARIGSFGDTWTLALKTKIRTQML